MAMFNLTTVTDGGKEAMQSALENGYAMTFSRLVTGNGVYAAGEDIKGLTGLKNQKNSYSFSSIEKDADGSTLKAAITNNISGASCVDETYNVNEIGIYVTVNGEDYLYAVAAVGGGVGAELPAYTGDNSVQILQEWYVSNSNDAEINIDASGAYALEEDVAKTTDALDTRITELENNSGGSFLVTVLDAYNAMKEVMLSNGVDTQKATLSEEGEAEFIVTQPGTYTASVDGEELGSTEVGKYQIKGRGKVVKLAFHYSENDSNPDSVTYPAGYDNSDFTDTAYMDFDNDKFHYGDWDPEGTNADILKWFFPKSCMLKYDGTVDYYLDENDETIKADGTASDVADISYGGNAMMEWGQDDCIIYWKIVPDADGKGFTFVIANSNKDDPKLMPWNHYDCNGDIKDHFYVSKYFGSADSSGRLRSISGGSNYVNHGASDEIAAAKKNNTTSEDHYNIEVYADWLLEGMLDILLAKSTNTQAKYGTGRCASGNSSAIGQGTMNGKGMFYGKNDQTSGVKLWGRENPYGNLWHRLAGLINANGTVKIKLTYGKQDGSTVEGYNMDGTGYISHSTIGGTSGGYISHMHISERGLTPETISGSDSTYYCDGGWFNNSQVNYAVVGGNWHNGLLVGAFCWYLHAPASDADSGIGAALSYK